MIDHPPRSPDHDVRPFFQLVKLPLIRRAAVDGHRAHPTLEGHQLVHLVGHLRRQLPRRAEYQHLRHRARRIDFLDGRNRKRSSLARTRLRLPHHVAPLHEHRNGRCLNGRRLLEAERLDGLQNFGRKPQIGESWFLHSRPSLRAILCRVHAFIAATRLLVQSPASMDWRRARDLQLAPGKMDLRGPPDTLHKWPCASPTSFNASSSPASSQ